MVCVYICCLSNGAEAFSPDGQWILGRAPEVENYYVAAGMRSNGIASAGGVGTVIADWIVNDRPPFDMYGLDIARCLGHHNNKRFLRDRVREVPGLTFAMNYPHSEFTTGRALRTSPIFPKLQLAGAQFGQVDKLFCSLYITWTSQQQLRHNSVLVQSFNYCTTIS